jgi:hypothetical protein
MRAQSFAEKAARRAKRRPKLGPTGDFPHGKLSSDDEGGINVALGHHIAPDGTRMVQLDFGKPVAWLSLPGDQAIAFALTLMKHAGFLGSVVIGDGGIVDASNLGRRGQSDPKVES